METSYVKGSPEWIAERDTLILAWDKAKADLEAAKALEIELRKKVVSFSFDPEKKSGTECVELGNGFELKAVKKITYGFVQNDKGLVDKRAIETALEKLEKDGPAGEMVAERLIKWKPELSLTEYKLLEDKYKKIIDKVIVTKDATPTLEIIKPKVK